MRLIPAGLSTQSQEEDLQWIEKPGFPQLAGTWLRATQFALPEFKFDEGHEKTRNEPPPRLLIGTHEDSNIRVDSQRIPRSHCSVFKEGRNWFVEALSPSEGIWVNNQSLEIGVPFILGSGDVISLLRPPTQFAFRIEFTAADNWYLDEMSEKDFPNRWPSKMPGHHSESPPAPEELKRLAWQTDQMRRRSEEEQVRVADWAAFSQYVKQHYHKYGISAQPWSGSLGPPVERPLPPGARKLPDWIADLVVQEQMPVGVDRELPFKEALELSNRLLPQSIAPMPAGKETLVSGLNKTELKEKDLHGLYPSLADMSFQDWLCSLEDARFMLQYQDAISSNFDSLRQLIDVFVKDGELDPLFFEVVKVHKLGHQRIFEKWFRQHCQNRTV